MKAPPGPGVPNMPTCSTQGWDMDTVQEVSNICFAWTQEQVCRVSDNTSTADLRSYPAAASAGMCTVFLAESGLKSEDLFGPTIWCHIPHGVLRDSL